MLVVVCGCDRIVVLKNLVCFMAIRDIMHALIVSSSSIAIIILAYRVRKCVLIMCYRWLIKCQQLHLVVVHYYYFTAIRCS